MSRLPELSDPAREDLRFLETSLPTTPLPLHLLLLSFALCINKFISSPPASLHMEHHATKTITILTSSSKLNARTI